METKQENNLKINREFLQKFSYLFFVDINGLNSNTYAEYEKREAGYVQSMIEGYKVAFNEKLDRQISIDFVKKIHLSSMNHRQDKSLGMIKDSSNFFCLNLPILKNEEKLIKVVNPNATKEGFWQLANNWLIGQKNPIHFIHLKSGGCELYFTPINAFGKKGLWVQVMGNGKLFCEPYEEKYNALIEQFLENSSFECFVNSTSTDMWPYLGYGSLQEVVTNKMQEICDSYNISIMQANTNDEKLEIIVKHVQLIDQLHPFLDGNVRTCYILLNRLLHEEKMPISLQINPNRFDGLSIAQLANSVKEGQGYFATLIQGQIPNFKDELLPFEPKINSIVMNCESEQLENFIDILIRNIQRNQTKLGKASEQGMFSYNEKIDSSEQTLQSNKVEEPSFGPLRSGYRF